MHASVHTFVERALTPTDVADRQVLEVGSLDVNGSVRPFVESLEPLFYLGTDMCDGPGVDWVCPAEQLVETFGPWEWGCVISTECLEHVEDWRAVVRNLKGVVSVGGVLLVTTRSFGFPYHPYPIDTWRYELADMERIFADFAIEILEPDPQDPGVFLRARKRDVRQLVDLDAIQLRRWNG